MNGIGEWRWLTRKEWKRFLSRPLCLLVRYAEWKALKEDGWKTKMGCDEEMWRLRCICVHRSKRCRIKVKKRRKILRALAVHWLCLTFRPHKHRHRHTVHLYQGYGTDIHKSGLHSSIKSTITQHNAKRKQCQCVFLLFYLCNFILWLWSMSQ